MTPERNRKQSASKTGFRIVLACEDSSTGARALKLCQRLSSRLSSSVPLSHSMWKFGALEAPNARHTAAREAGTADMVILAMQGEQPLPGHIRSWLESFLDPNVKRTQTLVALMERPTADPATAELRNYLRELATRGQWDLFVHGPELVQSPEATSWSGTYSSPAASPATAGPPAPQVSGWGINE